MEPRKTRRTNWEETEQKQLFRWAGYHERKWPDLRFLFHVPNERIRYRERAKMKVLGVKPGVPDLCLPVPRRGAGCLWIELKAAFPRRGTLTPDQQRWLDFLNANGARAVVCSGWEEAARTITEYLEGGP